MTTPDELAEASFTQVLLENPDDVTARLAFADWLEEHGRSHQANYLKTIRKWKFVREVARFGGWGLVPPWDRVKMPPVPKDFDIYKYTNVPPPVNSPRLLPWIKRIQMGWSFPKHVKYEGYSTKTQYFGVYVWEYQNVLSPMFDGDVASGDHLELLRDLGVSSHG